MSNFQYRIKLRGVVREEGIPTARTRVNRRGALAGGKRATGPRAAGKILTIQEAVKVSKQARAKGTSIVLAGGCFDILHAGHISFLDAAKKQGNLLFILLESNENVRKIKGQGRPVNSQKNRSIVLSVLSSVDYIIPLRGMTKNDEYDKLIVQIKPDVIAMTKNEPGFEQRKKQASMVGAKVKLVIDRVKEKSTSGLINKNG